MLHAAFRLRSRALLCLCPDAFGVRSGLCQKLVRLTADRGRILIRSGLCGLEHLVQLQRGLRDGACIFNVDAALLKLRGQCCIFSFQLIFTLFEGLA